tara:strand:+ start:174 stop:563 length:390 start_codon:yes stop_codon:yes gene_type:complete
MLKRKGLICSGIMTISNSFPSEYVFPFFTHLIFGYLRNNHVMKITEKEYLVLSQNGGNCSTVRVEREDSSIEYYCTCPQFAYRKNMCKHMFAVGISCGLQKQHGGTARKKKNYSITPGRSRRQLVREER